MTAPVDDDFTELVDADIPRVDLVDKAANGTRFILAKQAEGQRGLLDPAFVRDLIAKAGPADAVPVVETVTMTGSPAAIAKLIHQAAQRADAVVKAKYDADDLRRMAANGEAMADESYPIADREDLDRAIRAVGRGGADHDAIRRHVERRAKALGASAEIPDNWNADGSLKGTVAKETSMDDDLDPTTPLAEPDGDAGGVPTEPGSPAWEAVDAATARKWTAILARAKGAIDLLAEREMMEAAAGADIDGNPVMAVDLRDACCAIDYAISVLAPFAVAEQAEADCGEEMAAVGKALTGWDVAPLDTIEALASITKAGRVLSAANEAAIRGAVESLQKVLASLPAAPTTDDGGQPVAKTEENVDMPKPETSTETVAATGQEPEMGIAKADGEKPPMRAVYDAAGRLVGIVDPADITPIEDTEPAAEPDGDEPPADDGDGESAPETPDLEPAPAGEVGTPADAVPDDVTKQTSNTTVPDEVLKGIAADVVKAQLDAYSAIQQEAIAKQAAALEAMADTVEVLKDRVGALEEQPAQPKVFTNGAVPPAHQMRGQDRGSVPVDVAKVAEMKKALYGAADATEQNRIYGDMQAAAVARLQEIHQRR